MHYIPHTDTDIQVMLQRIGVASLDDLFDSIPEALRLREPLNLPTALDEQSLIAHMETLAARNGVNTMRASFLGAGMYAHFIPTAVDHILLRGEYLTSYTPYQAEMSQGTLKTIFEFQTMMAEILGYDLANASVYDGAHAVAEGLSMALRSKPKAKRVILSSGMHPEYRAVAQTYLTYQPDAYHTTPCRDGVTDLDALRREDLSDVAALMIQSPNFYGNLEDIEATVAFCREKDILCAVCFNEPLAFALVQPPGACGADIAVGEAQSLGIPMGFGGPALGVFACKDAFLRAIPGRLVSRTTDADGRESYVLTLTTREQHIRRERAASNICTNQALMALATTIYLSLLGKQGFPELAALNRARAHYAKNALCALDGVSQTYPQQTFFNEFTLTLPVPAAHVVAYAAEHGIAAGVDLGRFNPNFSHQLLVAVTELNSRAAIDALVEVIAAAIQAR